MAWVPLVRRLTTATVLVACAAVAQELQSVQDLASHYGEIFPTGNRNAASHLWAHFVLQRAGDLPASTLRTLFRGFCPVSGSPLPDEPHTRFHVTLPRVDGGQTTGITHHCCWPCICDLQDLVRVDSKTVTTADGSRTYDFLVIGDPCSNPDKMSEPFADGFGHQSTLQMEAPELKCAGEHLRGAELSDHGHPIIGMFFTAEADVSSASSTEAAEFNSQCVARRTAGYNSGMGTIFHQMAGIAPVPVTDPISMAELSESMHVGGHGRLSVGGYLAVCATSALLLATAGFALRGRRRACDGPQSDAEDPDMDGQEPLEASLYPKE